MNENSTTIYSLDASHYTDPAVFDTELNGLLSGSWQYAGHVSRLAQPGDYFCFEVAGQNLFCVRDQSTIRTFYNVCQHRAHELLKGAGRVNSKLLVCPYHAWSYKLDGHLVTGPNINVVNAEALDKVCLTSVRTEIFCGFVFVNLDPEAEPMEAWFPNVESELRAFVPQIDSLQQALIIDVPEQCNWKVSVENYSECYHCRLNHPTFASGVVKSETYDIQARGYCLRHTTECQNLENMSYPIDITANEHAGDYSSWYLWPGFSFQVYPGNILNTYHWTPVNVDHVLLRRGWYTTDGQVNDTIEQLAKQDRETTVEEDIHLVESVHRGLKNRGYKPGPLVLDPDSGVNSEHSIKVLQGWMREAVE